jgi:CubicO group peptidase (beta-lactamase class C family)
MNERAVDSLDVRHPDAVAMDAGQAAVRHRRRTILPAVLATLVAMGLWAALALHATLAGWGRPTLAAPGDAEGFARAAIQRIDAANRGNVVLRVITAGQVTAAHQRSIGAPVDADTLFHVASVSKWITACAVLTLVESRQLDLDAPVGTYLRRWSLPAGEHDATQVTVRRLLSHTAGLTDGLGYAGFPPGTPVQSLEASLTRAADASPGADGRVRVGEAPGSGWRYSGGGYALLQLVVEDVTGEPFADYVRRAVFQPLGMSRSTFVLAPGTANVATIHDRDGSPLPHRRFTALAAAALYTTAADLTRFLQAQAPDAKATSRVLRPETWHAMRAPHAALMGADIWGLGTMLYVPNARGGFIVGHDGSDEPATNAAVRLDPDTGDGIIVLQTGDPLLATTIAGEWTFWQAGAIDALDFRLATHGMLADIGAGWLAILVVAVLLQLRRHRRHRMAT